MRVCMFVCLSVHSQTPETASQTSPNDIFAFSIYTRNRAVPADAVVRHAERNVAEHAYRYSKFPTKTCTTQLPCVSNSKTSFTEDAKFYRFSKMENLVKNVAHG